MSVETERVTLRLPKNDLDTLDMFIQAGEFMNRSDVIRAAIKDFVRRKAKDVQEGTEARRVLMEASSQNMQLMQLQEQLRQQQEILQKLMQK